MNLIHMAFTKLDKTNDKKVNSFKLISSISQLDF